MKKRELNIEGFRFIATLFVIILHVLGQGGILEHSLQGSSNYWIGWFLEICAFCAVNCFALITGYLMINKHIVTKNIISLWVHVLFYSILLSIVIFAVFPESLSLKSIIVALLPITGKQWWYISSYFALFFTIPFLNAGINSISQQSYKKLLITILVGVCFVSCVLPIDAFTLNNGYSAIWLDIVYLFGAYIRKYDLQKRITAKKSIINFLVVVMVTFISKFTIYYFTKNVLGEVRYDEKLISYTSITILLAAIFLFLFFLNIKIKENSLVSKVLCFFMPTTLGTYLIHTHPLVFDFLLKDAFACLANKNLFIMSLCIIASSFAIFTTCAIIELLRGKLFRFARVDNICKIVDNKINHLYLKIFNEQ